MFKTISYAIMLSMLMALTHSAPASMFDDIFPGFVANSNLRSPTKEGEVVKRTIIETNPDAKLKQISFNSLIGDIEQSLFHSALSLTPVAHDQQAVVPEITPTTERTLNKRHTDPALDATTTKSEVDNVATTEAVDESQHVLVHQTTKKVPEHEGVPAHILIDRISVQPHYGGVPLIPAFQVQHTKVVTSSNNNKDEAQTEEKEKGNTAEGTHITITKTSIQATQILGNNNPILEEHKKSETTESSVSSTTNESTSTTSTEVTTSKAPIVQLKEAKEELQEKIAEIEAEPVILSARV